MSDIYIRYWKDYDAESKLLFELRNKDLFQLYAPLKADNFYTFEFQSSMIRESKFKRDNDTKYEFGVFSHERDELCGTIDLFEVRRSFFQSCILGYAIDKHHNGKGYATQAVNLVLKFAFENLGLHRVEAGAMPENIGSIRVLQKAGFHYEGLALQNVKINDKWEDHQMFAIISS